MKQKGFALIAVLGLLMILSLVAAFIANYAEQRLEQAFQLRQQLQSQLDNEATLATLLHIIATRPLIQNSYLLDTPQNTNDTKGWDPFNASPLQQLDISQLARLTVEGQRYRGLGHSTFSLQDEGSLLSLLDPDRERWTALFQQYNLTTPQAERFLDQLLDYTDHDDLRRLNGANSADYSNQGLPLPSHRFMGSPGQVFNLLDGPSLQTELTTMLPLMTTHSGQLHNLNTAPPQVLQSIPGMDQALAQSIVDERQKKPFSSLADANERLGRIIPLDPLTAPTQASPFLRIRLWPEAQSCRQSIWLGLSSTPTSKIAPWEIDYLFTIDAEQPCTPPREQAFPLFLEPAMDR